MTDIVDGALEGLMEALVERAKTAPRWCAVAFSSWNGASGYAWNHRKQRHAEEVALRLCQAPQAQILASGADITIAVARGPQNAIGCQWAHLSMLTQACEDAIQRCRACFSVGAPEREQVWLSLVLDARQGLMYQQCDPIA